MNEGRAIVILALFAGGIVGGVALQRVSDAGLPASPYPSLERVEEPAAASTVAAALASNDAKGLARLMDADTLKVLKDALTDPVGAPMSDIRGVRFVGATEKDGHVLAGYVVTGRDVRGSDAIVGLVLDVENGQIVGVN